MRTNQFKPQNLCFLFLAFCFLLTTSMKCKKDGQEKEQLPPATQTGAHTFGFLLNGEVWLPKAALLSQKIDLSYEPAYKEGTLNIIAKRIILDENTDHYLAIGNEGINKVGVYPLFVYFHDNYSKCEYIVDKSHSVGTINITQINTTSKFISGTFEFTLEKEGCHTINATNGRFDLKIQ